MINSPSVWFFINDFEKEFYPEKKGNLRIKRLMKNGNGLKAITFTLSKLNTSNLRVIRIHSKKENEKYERSNNMYDLYCGYYSNLRWPYEVEFLDFNFDSFYDCNKICNLIEEHKNLEVLDISGLPNTQNKSLFYSYGGYYKFFRYIIFERMHFDDCNNFLQHYVKWLKCYRKVNIVPSKLYKRLKHLHKNCKKSDITNEVMKIVFDIHLGEKIKELLPKPLYESMHERFQDKKLKLKELKLPRPILFDRCDGKEFVNFLRSRNINFNLVNSCNLRFTDSWMHYSEYLYSKLFRYYIQCTKSTCILFEKSEFCSHCAKKTEMLTDKFKDKTIDECEFLKLGELFNCFVCKKKSCKQCSSLGETFVNCCFECGKIFCSNGSCNKSLRKKLCIVKGCQFHGFYCTDCYEKEKQFLKCNKCGTDLICCKKHYKERNNYRNPKGLSKICYSCDFYYCIFCYVNCSNCGYSTCNDSSCSKKVNEKTFCHRCFENVNFKM